MFGYLLMNTLFWLNEHHSVPSFLELVTNLPHDLSESGRHLCYINNCGKLSYYITCEFYKYFLILLFYHHPASKTGI
jgi:hypothetical protein